jgi:predicted DNA-binding protein (MmcQ/YjbR family)
VVPVALDGSHPDQLVRDMIEDSYDLVVSALPRRVREQLGWSPERG